ncbi:unnamed protein product [Closterium sp. NIES-54]
MASLRVLAFDHEGRLIQFDTWLDDLQLYPLSDSRDSVSLFDHTSGAAPSPPDTADSATRSHWLTRDAATRLAIRIYLPLAECAQFRQHRPAHALYDAVNARYSSPATAALGRLLLPYLFPELSAFATPAQYKLYNKMTMYALSVSAEGDYYLCVPPDPDIEAAALGASESALPGTALAGALHTFTLDSGASRCFFRDNTTLTPLSAPVPVRLADPSGGPVLAHSSTILPCPARVSICTCTRTGRHLATFTRRPGSSLYTLSTEPPQVAASAQVSASGPVAPPCSCRLLSHQTLLWHHRLGHPSLPHLRGMHSHLLVSGLPKSLPPLPPSPAPPCLPCVEGQQRAAPHSSSFPPTTAPLQTLHMDVWGPARVSGQGRERYFLLIRAVRLQLRKRFGQDLPILRLHSDRGANGIAERRIGLVMEVARTSIIHAAAPQFLWPFAVGDASMFQVWGSRAFVCDTSVDKLSARAIPSVFLGFPPYAPGWQFYHPTSSRVIPSQDVTFYHLFPYRSTPLSPPPLFLAPGPPPVDPLPPQGPSPLDVSQVDPLPGPVLVEVAGDSDAARGAASGGAKPGGAELGGAESEGAGSGGAGPGGAEPAGVEPGGAEPEGVEPGGPAGASPRLSPRPEPLSLQQLREWFAQRTRLRSGVDGVGDSAARDTGAGGVGATRLAGTGVTAGASDTGGVAAAGPGGARTRGTGAAGTGSVGGAGAGVSEAGDPAESEGAGAGDTGAGGAGAGGAGARDTAVVGAGARGTGAGGARAGGAGAVDPGAGGAGAGGTSAGGARAGGTSAGGARAGGAGAVDPRAGDAGAGGAVSGGTGAGSTVRSRPYFVPLLQQVLRLPISSILTPPLLFPPPHQSQPSLQPASPLPTPSPYTERTGGLTERREPESRPASTIGDVRTGRCVPRPRPPPVPGTHAMALRPSFVPLRVPLPPPPESSLPAVLDPASDLASAASPTVSRLLATIVTGPSFESTAAFALVAELVDFATTCRLDYATALVAESVSASPLSVEGECALGTDVLEDRQEDFECLAAAVPRFASMLLAPEGDPDAPDIPTPRSYVEFSSPQPTPLSTGHSHSAPPSDESVEPSGPYPELVGCLMYQMTCTQPDLAYPLSILARYVTPGRHQKVHWDAAKRVLRYLCSTTGMGLVLRGRGPIVLTSQADASWVDDSATQRSS